MSDLRDQIADAIARSHLQACGKLIPGDEYDMLADAAMEVVEADAARRLAYTERRVELARAAERKKIRGGILAEVDDHDPDRTMRTLMDDPQAGQGDPGHAGSSWWRAYCHIGGLMVALAYTEPEGDTSE